MKKIMLVIVIGISLIFISCSKPSIDDIVPGDHRNMIGTGGYTPPDTTFQK